MTTPDPKIDPKIEPAEESQVEQTVEPKIEPKVGPRIEPRIEAKKDNPGEQKQNFMAFVKDNIWESISYVVLFAGLILSIFNPFLGGSLVGIILGIYFSQEILDRSMSFKDLVVREGIFRGFIVIAAVLALLLEAPGLLVGTVIGAWIRPYLGKSISSPFDKQ